MFHSAIERHHARWLCSLEPRHARDEGDAAAYAGEEGSNLEGLQFSHVDVSSDAAVDPYITPFDTLARYRRCIAHIRRLRADWPDALVNQRLISMSPYLQERVKMYLREIAAAKAGDKGNTSNVSVFPYDENDYEFLRRVLTVEVVKEHFGDLVRGPIRRYQMPASRASTL